MNSQKKIHYKAENRQLIATISAGDEEGIKFIFKKRRALEIQEGVLDMLYF